MTRKSRREIENLLDDLDGTDSTSENPTRAELGISADFVTLEGEELDELPDGWTWDTDGRFTTAVREEDTD